MFNERTNYSIVNEHGDKSTITLDKVTADVLQDALLDVHSWIQATYNHVAERNPELGRIKKGDLVRFLAQKEADKHPGYHRRLEELLGIICA